MPLGVWTNLRATYLLVQLLTKVFLSWICPSIWYSIISMSFSHFYYTGFARWWWVDWSFANTGFFLDDDKMQKKSYVLFLGFEGQQKTISGFGWFSILFNFVLRFCFLLKFMLLCMNMELLSIQHVELFEENYGETIFSLFASILMPHVKKRWDESLSPPISISRYLLFRLPFYLCISIFIYFAFGCRENRGKGNTLERKMFVYKMTHYLEGFGYKNWSCGPVFKLWLLCFYMIICIFCFSENFHW